MRWIAAKLRFDGDKATKAVRQVGNRVQDLIKDKQLLRRVISFAALAWVLDAASLWVFLRAFGGTLDPDALFVAFGLANVMSVVPITPGGLGIVEWVYIPTLVGFNMSRAVAVLGVGVYRISQFFMPIVVGGLCYASLRFGPWKIDRRERFARFRTLTHEGESGGESQLEFLMPRLAQAGGAQDARRRRARWTARRGDEIRGDRVARGASAPPDRRHGVTRSTATQAVGSALGSLAGDCTRRTGGAALLT